MLLQIKVQLIEASRAIYVAVEDLPDQNFQSMP